MRNLPNLTNNFFRKILNGKGVSMTNPKNSAEKAENLGKEGVYLVFFIIGIMGIFGLGKSLFS
jgi:hypothetical protein